MGRVRTSWPVALGLDMRCQLSLAVLVGLLFCSLASIEVPELVKLTDDTSNDFTVMVSRPAATSVDVAVQSSVLTITAQQNAMHTSSFVPLPFNGAARRSRDVLHLCCVQQT
jgi:hypothetical protein